MMRLVVSASSLQLLLIRHGTTDANQESLFLGQSDVPLNATGRREADAVGRRLATPPLDRVVTSDLSRARETADAIVRHHATPVPLSLDPRLREMHLGDFEMVPARTVHAGHAALVSRWRNTPATVRMPGPDAETLAEVQARVWEAVEAISGEPGAQRIAVVSHTFALLALLCHVLAMPLDRFRQLHLDRASITELRFRRHGPTLIHFNDTSHLDERGD